MRLIAVITDPAELGKILRTALDEAHNLGQLKARIIANPVRGAGFRAAAHAPGPEESGKRMLLVTNSDWAYAQAMIRCSFDRFLPLGAASWRSLFDLVIVEARKPSFFLGRQAVYRLADEARGPGVHIPYVGDYLSGDVHVSKEMLRWRTGLVLRRIEPEILGIVEARDSDRKLEELIARKAELENRIAAALGASIAPLARQVG